MEIGKVTQGEVFEAVLARLIERIDIANEDTAWFDSNALPKDTPPQPECLIIAASNGHGDDRVGTSGSICSVTDSMSLTVTHMKQFQVDQPKQLSQIMVSDPESMSKYKQRIMSAMLGDRMDNGSLIPWQPKTQDGKCMLTQPFSYLSSVPPTRHKDWPYLYQYLDFSFAFNWLL